MINNRQGNRRRGRNNNPRQNNSRGGGDSGNRIDSRARGNAAQLLEKYKNMARDAQTQGDRVLTEYYLQFADHYFRVLADVRARQEEQQAERRARHEERSQNWREENEGMDIEGVEHGVEGEPMLEDAAQQQGAPAVEEGEGGEDRAPRQRARRDSNRPERGERSGRGERQPRNRADGGNAPANGGAPREDEPLSLDASLLPPSIAPVADEGAGAAAEVEVEVVKPRRGRRPKAVESSAEATE